MLLTKVEAQSAKIAALERHVFGKRSEKMPSVKDELRAERPTNPDETQAKRRENREAQKALPLKEISHQVPNEDRVCPTCGGTDLKPLGEGKITEVYEYVPYLFERQRHLREILACKCGEGIVTADGSTKAIEQGKYGPGLIAHVIVSKCADAMPVNRLSKRFERAGVPIARQTLNALFHAGAERLAPLSSQLLKEIAQAEIVHADETPMPEQAKGKTKKAYLWTFRTTNLIGYAYSSGRGQETPNQILGNTKGKLLVDGYGAYNSITTPEGRERAGCWAHVRRKFYESKEIAPVATEMVDMIRDLYRVEYEATDRGIKGSEAHLALRNEKSEPILKDVKKWLEAEKPNHLPKGPMGRAISYTEELWDELSLFLKDAKLPLDNNASERALRIAALGRKNFLFVGNNTAGKNLAGLYSLVMTCEANGINPEVYLSDVLIRINSHPMSRVDELLPHRWQSKSVEPNTS